MTGTVSVVIPTHDRPDQLQRLIDCLCRQRRIPDQLVIVNDGETETDMAILEQVSAAGVEAFEIRRNEPSSAASRNAGLSAANGDIVICLDDDMVPDEGFIADLLDLYNRDVERIVSGIGVPYLEENDGWKYRLWETFSLFTGRMRFRPRIRAANYIRPGPGLAGLLEPAVMLSGGSLSLRGEVAERCRFDETMGRYSFGEDREFSYRVGRTEPLYAARKMRIKHCPGPGGRGRWFDRGRVYVRNMLHVVRTGVEPGVGTGMMVAMDFAGAFFQHLLWGILTAGLHNVLFAAGMAGELMSRGIAGTRRLLCE